MNVWIAKAVVVVGSVAMIGLRVPHERASRRVAVTKSRKGALETGLLALSSVAFVLAIVWVATPLLAFADFPLHPLALFVGTVLIAGSLWLFHRSHVDLGTNWSLTLEVREGHTLVTEGVYAVVRHPMYLAFVVYSVGQALVLPNFLAGPGYLVAAVLVFAFRLGPEEQMMRDEFGPAYDAYAARTKRLVPGVW